MASTRQIDGVAPEGARFFLLQVPSASRWANEFRRCAAGVGERNLSRLSRHLYSVDSRNLYSVDSRHLYSIDSRHLDSVERPESFNCIRSKRRESFNRCRMNGDL